MTASSSFFIIFFIICHIVPFTFCSVIPSAFSRIFLKQFCAPGEELQALIFERVICIRMHSGTIVIHIMITPSSVNMVGFALGISVATHSELDWS